MIKILVVDDHPIFRQGIKLVLSEADDILVAGEAASGNEALDILRKDHSFDVVTLDLSMPGRDGLETLKEIRYEKIPVAVIMLSIHPEEQFAIRTLRAEANGYLSKTSVPDELVAAIRKVAQGGKYITSTIAEKMLESMQHPEQLDTPHAKLSDREHQIFCMIGQGKTVSDIASDLMISVKTVSTHRAHILKKMNMDSNAQLMHYAISNHLIE